MENYDYIRFAVVDKFGRPRGRVVPRRHAANCFQSGVPVYGCILYLGVNDEMVPSSYISHEKAPRMTLMPDLSTLHSVPWCGGDRFKVAEVICDSYWLKDKTPQHVCPRYVAREQLNKLEELDLKLLSGFEVEFCLRDAQHTSVSDIVYCHRETAYKSRILFEIENLMYKAGIDVENFHTEYGSDLFEMVLKPQDGITAADSAFTFKTGIQEISDKDQFQVLFQSDVEGSQIGMHFNHSVWSVSQKKNIFLNKSGDLSETGKHWLAGVLKHADALTALFSPTAKCYQRLHQPYRPSVVFWDPDDRSACMKVKSSTTNKGIYLENRMPSGMSNPYLVLAATVAAGLDGVKNKLVCPPPGTSGQTQTMLPRSLPEALQRLMADEALVESLGKDFVECFAATAE